MESSFTIAAALVTGLVSSVHCVGMCGPLACSLKKTASTETSAILASASYHGGRLIAYGSIGALCGYLGEQPLRWIFNSPAVVLPWMLVGVFLMTIFGLWKKLPRPQWLNRLGANARLRSFRLSATKGGLLMGLMTPLLPCGPLYLLFAACLLSGSGVRGAEFAVAFGVGTVPLLWLAQESFVRLQKVLPKARFTQLQRGVAIVGIAIMTWRLHDTLPMFAHENGADLPTCCPVEPPQAAPSLQP